MQAAWQQILWPTARTQRALKRSEPGPDLSSMLKSDGALIAVSICIRPCNQTMSPAIDATAVRVTSTHSFPSVRYLCMFSCPMLLNLLLDYGVSQ